MPRFLDNLLAVPLQGGTAIFYRGISTGSTDTTHTVSGLVNGAGKSFLPTASSPHFSPPDGRSMRYDRQDFVALACRAQRTVQVRLRAPSGARLALTALSPTSPRRVVRNAGYATPAAPEPQVFSLDFPHFANGGGADLSGSERVVVQGAPLGGVLRYSVPEVGVTGVGAVAAQAGRDPDGGGDAQPGRGNDRADVPLDERRRGSGGGDDLSGAQRADVMVHRRRVHRDRHDGLRGDGALQGAGEGSEEKGSRAWQ